MNTNDRPDSAALALALGDRLGAGAVITDAEERAFCSTDVYSAGAVAALVVRPGTPEQVQAAVSLITESGHAVLARGGGMSYTGGYTPAGPDSVVLDLSALDRIIEINEADRVITVEAGVTWQQIHEALRPRGLRLPFFGTFSGSRATVGGGLSNGALFLGTARHGTAAEIVVGMDVVDGRGRLVRTGQAAFHRGRPAFRNYGPDLTGLFTHDAGALGVKVRASLRLMTAPGFEDHASWAFADRAQAVAALSDLGRSGCTEEAYLFDPATTARSLDGDGLRRDLARLAGVVRAERGLAKGLLEAAKLAAAGRGFVDTGLFTLHAVFAGRSEAAVRDDKALAGQLVASHEGSAISPSMPRAARANPFEPLNGVLGKDGERWAALNAKVPHSDAPALVDATEALVSRYAEPMQRHGVSMSYLFIAIQEHVFSYEPVLRWHDAWLPVHHRVPEPAYLAGLQEPAPNPEARALVDEIRSAIVALFAEHGAASNQIGKTYPHMAQLNGDSRSVLAAMKRELDPKGLLNPGALGTFS